MATPSSCPGRRSFPPPRLWKLTGCGKLRATGHPRPDLPTTVGNPGLHPPPRYSHSYAQPRRRGSQKRRRGREARKLTFLYVLSLGLGGTTPSRPPARAPGRRGMTTNPPTLSRSSELPLERAHIIAWSRSKDHSAENLLCLCANCHGRADTEKWGEETLRQYKQQPWVIRARIKEATARSAALSPLHQLPTPSADFTGREADLAELELAR
jgi:hypothetical protein